MNIVSQELADPVQVCDCTLCFAVEYAPRPRTYAISLSDRDGHRSVLRRQQSVSIAHTRSLDDLDQLQDQPESEFTPQQVVGDC